MSRFVKVYRIPSLTIKELTGTVTGRGATPINQSDERRYTSVKRTSLPAHHYAQLMCFVYINDETLQCSTDEGFLRK